MNEFIAQVASATTAGPLRAVLNLPGSGPYSRHKLIIDRSPVSQRLRGNIESYGVGQSEPARVEFGLLHKLAPTLAKRYNVTGTGLARALNDAGLGMRLAAEVLVDLDPQPIVPDNDSAHVRLPVTMHEQVAA